MLKIYLIRHGRTEWNKLKKVQGHADVPLIEEGRDQARQAASFFCKIGLKAVYSSDLKRASETAEIIAVNCGLTVELHPGLCEIDMGRWQGLVWPHEVGQKEPENQKQWQENPLLGNPSGGETLAQAAQRAWQALEEIVANHETGNILIVSHGLVIGTIICCVRGVSLVKWPFFSPDNTCLTVLSKRENKLELEAWNLDLP